jgi:transcriptional regulator with XRE-family HTH domain
VTPRGTDEDAEKRAQKRAIGQRIRDARKAAGLSQEQFVEAIGIPRRTVSRWENGTNLPDEDNRPKVSKLLNVPEDDLRLPTPQETLALAERVEQQLREILELNREIQAELTAFRSRFEQIERRLKHSEGSR